MVNYSRARLDRVFRALGDPTRRAMIQRLARGPALVTELAAPLRMSLPAASKHIRALETAGLVRRSVRGREHHCSLNPVPLKSAADWLARYRTFWTARLDALESLLISRGDAHER